MRHRIHFLFLLSLLSLLSILWYLFFITTTTTRTKSPGFPYASYFFTKNQPQPPPSSSKRSFKLKKIFHRPWKNPSSSTFSTSQSPASNRNENKNVFYLDVDSSSSSIQWVPPTQFDELFANNDTIPSSWLSATSYASLPLFDVVTQPSVSLPPPSTSFSQAVFQPMEYVAPNVLDQQTLVSLAQMAASSYLLPSNPGWVPIDGYKTNISFGWNNDGLRGYVYTTDLEDLVIVAIKGTTASFLGIGGDTASNDKSNDNHMFSCCCAHVDFTWKPICNCFQSGHFCNQTCLQENSIYDASYYQASLDLYHAIWQAYPASMQWFTGHSLGGALAGLLAVTYVRPAVTFQAPGEKRYAHTLGLPMNQFPALPVYHVGVDVDPIYLGHCQGVTSPCYLAGYAIETFCHLGHTCRLKVKQNLRLQEDIKYHRIGQVVELLQELKNSQNLTDPTSSLFNSSLIQCEINHGCHDCRSWKYY